MDITKWEDTWGTIDWKNDSEDEIKKKIVDFYHAGVDFNMEGRYAPYPGRPLHLAAAFSTVGVVSLLMDGGADIRLKTATGSTALHYAVRENKTDNVQYLMNYAPRGFINTKNVFENTALHEAVVDENVEMVELLISCGADVNIEAESADTALHRAAKDGSLKIVNDLIVSGANVNKKNKDGETPLHCASWPKCQTDVAKTLIEHGADVNVKDKKFGQTPLHFAAMLGAADFARVLIEAGANVNIKDDCGRLVLDVAKNSEIEELIENADKIRAEYLAKHSKGSLYQTLSATTTNSSKISLLKDKKTR